MEINPSYLAFLEGLNEVDKAQLLYGCWDAVPQGANYWQREWVKEITTHEMPSDVIACRAYDLAATERSQVNKNPDPTAAGKLYRDSEGYFYMAGEYHKEFYDDKLEIYGQFCKRSGDRDNHIIKQAHFDGDGCTIVLPVDPGAAGKSSFNAMASRIIEEGFMVKPDPAPINKSKLIRFQPFASACEIGRVFILVDTFDKKTLEFIRKQLENFNGERSTATRKDEFPDLFATAFNYLSTKRVTKAIPLPTFSNDTKLSQYRKSLR